MHLRLTDPRFSWQDLVTWETGKLDRTRARAEALTLQVTVPARDVRIVHLLRENP
jgi:hypothetical protein